MIFQPTFSRDILSFDYPVKTSFAVLATAQIWRNWINFPTKEQIWQKNKFWFFSKRSYWKNYEVWFSSRSSDFKKNQIFWFSTKNSHLRSKFEFWFSREKKSNFTRNLDFPANSQILKNCGVRAHFMRDLEFWFCKKNSDCTKQFKYWFSSKTFYKINAQTLTKNFMVLFFNKKSDLMRILCSI